MALGGATTTTIVDLDQKYGKEGRAKFLKLAQDLSSKEPGVREAALKQGKEMSSQERALFKEFGADLQNNKEHVKRLREEAAAAAQKVDASQQRVDASQQRVDVSQQRLAAIQQEKADAVAANQQVIAQRTQLQQKMAADAQKIEQQQKELRRLSDEENHLKKTQQELEVQQAALTEQARTMLKGFTISGKPATPNLTQNNNNAYTGKKAAFN